MENNAELTTLLNEFCENVNEAIKPVLEAIKNIMDSLSTAFLEAWKEVKFDMRFFEKNISCKRFRKLLMSIGYQRNDANKIVMKYRNEKGEYTLLDFLIENKQKEDLKNGMVRN